jgi:hypothetical protein
MEFLAARSMVQLSFTTLTLGVVAALAIVRSALGLYGVLSKVENGDDIVVGEPGADLRFTFEPTQRRGDGHDGQRAEQVDEPRRPVEPAIDWQERIAYRQDTIGRDDEADGIDEGAEYEQHRAHGE